MPLVNYLHVSALTKANISLNIIPMYIFHSCLWAKKTFFQSGALCFGKEMMQSTIPATKPSHTTIFSPFPSKSEVLLKASA